MNAPFEHGKYRADDGDIMGDYAYGDTPSRRFVQQREDGTYTVITEYAAAYVVNPEERPRVYDIQNMTEIMHCSDLEDNRRLRARLRLRIRVRRSDRLHQASRRRGRS
jgi:hypothetical protein